MEYKQIAKGLEVLSAVSIEEVDNTITWLEEALAAYKMLKAVKSVVARKPINLEAPEWESAVDLDRRLKKEDSVKSSGSEVKPLVINAFQQEGNEAKLTVEQISNISKLDKARVYQCLNNHQGKTFRRVLDTNQWQLIVAEISGKVA